MSEATDIFLIPWRTRDANELKRQPAWGATIKRCGNS
jgi:hypothetical protein